MLFLSDERVMRHSLARSPRAECAELQRHDRECRTQYSVLSTQYLHPVARAELVVAGRKDRKRIRVGRGPQIRRPVPGHRPNSIAIRNEF